MTKTMSDDPSTAIRYLIYDLEKRLQVFDDTTGLINTVLKLNKQSTDRPLSAGGQYYINEVLENTRGLYEEIKQTLRKLNGIERRLRP